MQEQAPKWHEAQIEGLSDLKRSYQLLEKAGPKGSTEALIMVAQEQGLSTR